MRSLAAIAFSFSAAILLLGLLPAGSWIFWAAGLLAAAGGCVLLLPRLRARRRLRAYLLLILFAASAGLLYGRGWSAIISDPVQEKCGGSRLFSATVCDWPERTDSGGWRVTVRLTEARGAKAVCYAKDEEMGGLEPGQAVLGSAVITALLFAFKMDLYERSAYLLVVRSAAGAMPAEEMEALLKENTASYRVRMSNATGREEEITYEISLSGRKKQTPQALQKQLMELQGVCSVNFVSYSGEAIG